MRMKSKALTFEYESVFTVLHQHRWKHLEQKHPVCEVEGCASHTSGGTQPSVLFASRALTMVGEYLQVLLLCADLPAFAVRQQCVCTLRALAGPSVTGMMQLGTGASC